jgi:hypothetical protein
MRTPAQYAADRRRSHKAQAKKCQRQATWAYEMAKTMGSSTMRDVAATYARMARSHLNFLLSGRYKDFT